MEYRRLGNAGIQVSAVSFGSWVTFGTQIGVAEASSLLKAAFDHGINFFDNAEVYANGRSEEIMGEALKQFTREDIVVSTKIFWGGDGPNDVGLSRKHLIEGTRKSLQRLQLEYVDLLFCHRPDPDTPIEETVRAMNYLIDHGYTFYWGTSEWSAAELQEAFTCAERLGLIPPSMEQPQYNMLVRDRFEKEYAPLFESYNLGTTIWSPLASGALSGKYNDGIKPEHSQERRKWVERYLNSGTLAKLKALGTMATELGISQAQLSIAWCLKNPRVSTVILGASNESQLLENIAALDALKLLDDTQMTRIQEILEG